jgi:hypothetical protein
MKKKTKVKKKYKVRPKRKKDSPEYWAWWIKIWNLDKRAKPGDA